MKELTVLSTNGVVIEKCLVDVKGKDIEINYHTPLHISLVSISLKEKEEETAAEEIKEECTAENPCCDRRGEYNGFDSGPVIFTCPKRCECHD